MGGGGNYDSIAEYTCSTWHVKEDWFSQEVRASHAWPLGAIGSYFLNASSVSIILVHLAQSFLKAG